MFKWFEQVNIRWMKDIEDRNDIIYLVDTFYDQVKENKTIGPIFDEVAKINWQEHLPNMYDFWESVLFGKGVFKGNPMIKHILLSKKTTMSPVQFDAWLELWTATVNANFMGKKSDEIISKAKSIANLMLYKIEQAKTFA
jgi:hemoglobin